MWNQQPPNECLCCYEQKKKGTSCSHGHFICKECKRKLSRSDCLICNPLSNQNMRRNRQLNLIERIIHQHNPVRRRVREEIPMTWLCRLRYYTKESILWLVHFIVAILWLVVAFFVMGYLGKVCVWCFLSLNPEQETPDWFSWYPQKTNLTEFMIGLIMTAVCLVLLHLCVIPVVLCYLGRFPESNRRNRRNRRNRSQEEIPDQMVQDREGSLDAIV